MSTALTIQEELAESYLPRVSGPVIPMTCTLALISGIGTALTHPTHAQTTLANAAPFVYNFDSGDFAMEQAPIHITAGLFYSGLAQRLVSETAEIQLAREFKLRVAEWNESTKLISSTSRLFSNPAYQRIVGMGKPAIKYVLKELQNDSGRWFHALKYMAGMDAAEGCNNYKDAKEAWLKWGRDNNYI